MSEAGGKAVDGPAVTDAAVSSAGPAGHPSLVRRPRGRSEPVASVTVSLIGAGFMVLAAGGSFVERRLGDTVARLDRLASLPPSVVVLDLRSAIAVDATGEAVLRDFVRTVQASGARVDITNDEHLDLRRLTDEHDRTSAA